MNSRLKCLGNVSDPNCSIASFCKRVFALRFCRFPPLSNRVSHGVASTRALLQILLSHESQPDEAGGATWDSEMRMTKDGEKGGVLCNICRVTEYQRKDGRRKDGRRKGSCCHILLRCFQPLLQRSNHVRKREKKSNWGHECLVNRCHPPPRIPLFSVSSTCSHANARLPEDGMSQT